MAQVNTAADLTKMLLSSGRKVLLSTAPQICLGITIIIVRRFALPLALQAPSLPLLPTSPRHSTLAIFLPHRNQPSSVRLWAKK